MSSRAQLMLTVLAILAIPMVIGVGAWLLKAYEAFRHCDLGLSQPTSGALRFGAVSYSEQKVSHVVGSATDPHLYLRSASLSQLTLDAADDVTFVTCALDRRDQRTLLKFRRYRADQLGSWLDAYSRTHVGGQLAPGDTVYVPAEGAHPRGEARRLDTAALLLAIAVRWASVIPDWVDKQALRNPRIVGWLHEGVLLETSSPERWLWVSYGQGLTGRMRPDGRCSAASDDGPLCRGSSAGHRTAPVYALLDAGDLGGALEQALQALENTTEPALRAELAVSLLRALRRPWAPMVKWLGCPRLDAALRELERDMHGISHPTQTDENAEGTSPSSASGSHLADALVDLLRAHRCAAEVP